MALFRYMESGLQKSICTKFAEFTLYLLSFRKLKLAAVVFELKFGTS